MKKILLSCFEPFGVLAYNSSRDAVEKVNAPCGTELYKITLPVEWKTSFEKLGSAWNDFSPDAVIMTGLAAGSDCIRVERVGLNLCLPIKDSKGFYPGGSLDDGREVPIAENAPDAIFSTFPCENILSALKKNKIRSVLSLSAGGYICNYVLYSALRKNSTEKTKKPIGFIHFPCCGSGPDFKMSLDDAVRALEITLQLAI